MSLVVGSDSCRYLVCARQARRTLPGKPGVVVSVRSPSGCYRENVPCFGGANGGVGTDDATEACPTRYFRDTLDASSVLG